jgi:hypothetical protein
VSCIQKYSNRLSQYELERWNASVLFDVLQNVVPLYDQRRIQPTKDDTWRDLCVQAHEHFERSFAYR